MDPKSIHHSVKEGRRLMKLGDMDKNGKLEWNEVLANFQPFISSKFFDSSKYFYAEIS